jgi:histidinol-phosphate aminotransferase
MREGHGLIEHGGPDLGPAVRWDFSSNANAFGPVAGVAEALAQAERQSYPEPSYLALRQHLAAVGLGAVDRLLPTAGNAEAIRRLTLAARQAGVAEVWVPEPGYGEYRAAAEALGLAVHRHRGAADLARLVEAWPPGRRLVWLCEPCNPTGQDVHASTWQALAGHCLASQAEGAVWALDRAYAPMRLDGLDPIPRALADACWQLWSPNKALGCTGVRAGMMVAPTTLTAAASALQRTAQSVAPSWVLSAEGVALLQAWMGPVVQAALVAQRATWAEALHRQQAALQALGWTVQASVVPFFLARPPAGMPVSAVLCALRDRGIRLRDATSLGLPGWCRLRAMPAPAQQALVDACRAVQGHGKVAA